MVSVCENEWCCEFFGYDFCWLKLVGFVISVVIVGLVGVFFMVNIGYVGLIVFDFG